MNCDEATDEAGIWTWCLERNVLYADTALAGLFGLDAVETLAGLPVDRYVARIHPDDRGRVAKSMSDAVIGGMPYFEEYRVKDGYGETRRVMALGRCFRDRSGNPVHYAGITYPLDAL